MGEAALVAYIVLKYLAYAAWMLFGLRLFAAPGGVGRALWLGFVRAAMGVGFGALIFVASLLVVAGASSVVQGIVATQVITYLLVYIPVRWIEWGIMEAAVRRGQLRGRFLGGLDRPGRLWRLGGIGVSCLADLAMVVALGSLPLGRFMC